MSHRFLRRRDPAYPPLLAAIHDPPPGLWLRGAGDPELLASPSVAIVGARSCSAYGRAVARLLGRELAGAGLVVVSGMARGIDAEAHRGALEARGGTVAVLGCGIDRDYPAVHGELARGIGEHGLLISEYEQGVEPAPWRFPARNRIIAGLCAATVVVEARERSGALITADFALEDGREVMAVPGEITSALSAGTNALLRLGATPVTRVADVLEVFGIELASNPEPAAEGNAATVLGIVNQAAASMDDIARATGLSPVGGLLDGRFAAAIRHPPDGVLQPARLVRRLAALAAEAGVEIRERTRVASIEQLAGTPAIICTDGYPSGLLGALEGLIVPTRGQVIATEPVLGGRFAVPHYGRHGFDYWHQAPDGRIVAGGFRDVALETEFTAEEEVTEPVQAALRDFVNGLVGRELRVDFAWAGIFGLVLDFMPVVGRVPGSDEVWVAAGYSGHGNVLGFASGELVARALLGEGDSLLPLFEPARLLNV